MDLNPTWIAVIGTVFGASGLEFVRHWLNRETASEDLQSKFRGELSNEIQLLRTAKTELDKRIDEVEKELDETRDKYWKLREDYAKLQGEFVSLQQELIRLKPRS